MNRSPTVSVIMPAYNAGKTIAQSIKSVLNQEYKNLELFIVDDGSTDNTSEIIKKFNDSRIKYLYQRNPGLGSAASPRNLALQKINSKYVSFLDADDLWHPNKLAEQIQHFESLETNVALVHSHFGVFSSTLDTPIRVKNKYPCTFDNDFYNLIVSNFISLPTVIIRTSALKDVGLFKTNLKGLEDWDLWIRISEQYSISFLPKDHAMYRLSPDSMSGNRLEYAKLELDYINTFLESHCSIPPEVSSASIAYNQFKVMRLHASHHRYRKAINNFLALLRITIQRPRGPLKIYRHLLLSTGSKLFSRFNP